MPGRARRSPPAYRVTEARTSIPTSGAELHRVAHQVGQHLFDAHAVPLHDDVGWYRDGDRAVGAAKVGRHRRHHLVDELVQVRLLDPQPEPVARQTAHVEQPVDQRRQPARLALGGRGAADGGRVAGGRTALERARQDLDLQEQRGEGRAQLVGRDRQEIIARPDRLQRLGEEAAVLEADGGARPRDRGPGRCPRWRSGAGRRWRPA